MATMSAYGFSTSIQAELFAQHSHWMTVRQELMATSACPASPAQAHPSTWYLKILVEAPPANFYRLGDLPTNCRVGVPITKCQWLMPATLVYLCGHKIWALSVVSYPTHCHNSAKPSTRLKVSASALALPWVSRKTSIRPQQFRGFPK